MNNYPAWKNGRYCKLQDLTVSILDLGLIHCDATYDVMKVDINGEIENYQAHMDRFARSCAGWRLPLPRLDDLDIVFQTLIAQAPKSELLLWVGVTRGVPLSGNPRDLSNCSTNVFAYVKPYYGFNAQNAATVCLSKRIRNDSIDQTMKNFAWSELNLAQWEAIDRGFDTAILLDRKGFLTEGPGFNVGIIANGGMVYAPRSNRLQGTTMDLVKNLCDDNDVYFEYTDIVPEFVDHSATAMFLTSTAGNVIPVKCFDGKYFSEDETLTWLQNNI
jgi:branched-chain amino acid aminotransferase